MGAARATVQIGMIFGCSAAESLTCNEVGLYIKPVRPLSRGDLNVVRSFATSRNTKTYRRNDHHGLSGNDKACP